MLGHDDADAGLVRERSEQLGDARPGVEVEVGERLVDEQQRRLLDDGRRDGDEGRLSGRERADVAPDEMLDADALRHLAHPRRHDDRRDAAHVEGEADLVGHALAGEAEPRLLQHDPDEAGGVARRDGEPVDAADLDACRSPRRRRRG